MIAGEQPAVAVLGLVDLLQPFGISLTRIAHGLPAGGGLGSSAAIGVAIGRAVAMNEAVGQVKMLAHAETDRILGVHMVGPGVSELIAECVVAMEFKGSSEDLARIVHAHPTLSEAVHEAALAVDKRSIHKGN